MLLLANRAFYAEIGGSAPRLAWSPDPGDLRVFLVMVRDEGNTGKNRTGYRPVDPARDFFKFFRNRIFFSKNFSGPDVEKTAGIIEKKNAGEKFPELF